MTPADDNGPDPGGDDLVAAEYVLGVLPAEQRQAAAARIERDAGFARLVDAWELHLSPMADQYDAVEPPAELKHEIDQRLFTRAASGAAAAAVETRAGLWQSLTFWRGLTALACAAFVIAVAAFILQPPPGERGARQQLVASVQPKDSDVQYVALYNPATQEIGLSHVAGERPQGKAFELWVIAGQHAPVSLGVIPEGQSVHLPVAPETRDDLAAGALFAISVEPPGGAPEGKPTGPVVAAGGLNAI
jgi:anti-sigma-K factor RskA